MTYTSHASCTCWVKSVRIHEEKRKKKRANRQWVGRKSQVGSKTKWTRIIQLTKFALLVLNMSCEKSVRKSEKSVRFFLTMMQTNIIIACKSEKSVSQQLLKGKHGRRRKKQRSRKKRIRHL